MHSLSMTNQRRVNSKSFWLKHQREAKRAPAALIKLASLLALSGTIAGIGEALALYKGRDSRVARAQGVATDGTTDTAVTPVPAFGGVGYIVTGGTLKGSNLFHSFEEFSPNSSPVSFDLREDAYSSVDNVFSRVTGGGSTTINSILQLLGGNQPNFFLLNPNGITVGSGASIYLPGAFLATTAEQILFEDATAFSAANILEQPLLTVSAPVGIQFGGTAAPISWQGSGIYADSAGRFTNPVLLPPGRAFTLLGGDASVSDTVVASAAAGRVQVGSLSPNTRVDIDALSHELTYQPDTLFQDVSIERSFIATSAEGDIASAGRGSGDITIRGRDVAIASTSLLSDNRGVENGGDIDIRATNVLRLADSSVQTPLQSSYGFDPTSSSSFTFYPSTGRSGNIYLEAEDVVVEAVTEAGSDIYNDQISASSYTDGDAGNITINAGTVSLLGDDTRLNIDSSIESLRVTSNSYAKGDGGTVSITAGDMNVYGNTILSSGTYYAPRAGDAPVLSSGDGGNVRLDIANSLTLENGANISTVSFSDGDAGDLFIKAGDIVLLDQSTDITLPGRTVATQISASSYGQGDGGNLTIEADELTASGITGILASSLYSSDFSPLYQSSGDGGNLTVTANSISLLDGSRIEASTYRSGDAGNLTIRAEELLLSGDVADDMSLAGRVTRIATLTADGGGAGGNMLIDVGSLMLGLAGQIGAGTFGSGDAGEVIVRASDRIAINGAFKQQNSLGVDRTRSSGIFNTAEAGASGNGGSLFVATPQLDIRDGGTLSVRTSGSGDAGDINIRADEISVADPVVDLVSGSTSGIRATVSALGSGSGGQVTIESDRLRVYNGGQIAASSSGLGKAGSVVVRANEVLIEGAASVDSIDNLTASTTQISSAISSSSTTGFDAGSVEITAGNIELRDRGTITVSNTAGGSAGNVDIVANSVKLSRSSIQAEASAGTQGSLNISSQDRLLLRSNSRLSANATGTATGGNIVLRSPVVVGIENSDISANALQGDGGSIYLATQGLIGLAFRDRLTSDSDITASSELGVSGTVDIELPTVAVDSGLVLSSNNLEDASDRIVAGCSAREGNRFAYSGRGGLPPNPFGLLPGNQLWNDFRGLERLIVIEPASAQHGREIARRETTKQKGAVVQDAALQEAGEWQVNALGEVELLATGKVRDSADSCLFVGRV